MTGAKEPTVHQETLNSMQGWLIVELGTCVLTMIQGTIFTFTVYADRFVVVFDLTQLQVLSTFSIIATVSLMVGGSFGMFAARLFLRPVLVIVGADFIVVIVLLQVVNLYLGVVAVFSSLGVTGGTVFTIAVSLTPQWFDFYQELATSLTMAGIGLGPLALPFVRIWHWCSTRHWTVS